MERNPYEVLGISPDASDKEVRHAYKKLVKKYHPDFNPGSEEAARLMKELNAAYEQIKTERSGEFSAKNENEKNTEAADTVENETQVNTNENKTAESTEVKKGILLTPGKIVGLIVGVVVLVAVLVGVIVYGMGGLPSNDAAETTAATEETVEPTYAVGTGRDDVTNKGTYTVSDEEIVTLEDRVVATMGDDVLTVADLQVHYWMQVQNFLYNYAYYLSYFGLDYTQPLDMQVCPMSENGLTWQQYFLEATLYNWHNYQAMTNVAKANGFTISEEDRKYLIALESNLKQSAEAQGFATAKELLTYNVGAGAGVEHYVNYEGLYVWGGQYYDQVSSAIAPTLDELKAYFAEHEAEYAESGITMDSGNCVDVRHILIVPEGKNPGETYTDEEWETIRNEAQTILDTWHSGEATEESFGELANKHSADSDGTDGGLYEGVAEGQMVTNFNDWCFDESRQPGDTDLVQTEYGYHVMYFVESQPIWQSYAESDLKAELAEQIATDAREAYPMEVDYSAIALGEVDIAKWFEY